jgi:hypothetical protein
LNLRKIKKGTPADSTKKNKERGTLKWNIYEKNIRKEDIVIFQWKFGGKRLFLGILVEDFVIFCLCKFK